MRMWTPLFGVLLVLQLQGFLTVSARGPPISSNPEYDKFRNAASLRCGGRGEAQGLGGNYGKLLKNNGRIKQFEKTLTEAQKNIFTQIRSNADVDISGITSVEMRAIIVLMENLPSDVLSALPTIRQAWASMTTTQRKAILRHPRVFLLLKREAHCALIGATDKEELLEYCISFYDESVSTVDALTSLDRCPYCAAQALENRAEIDLSSVMELSASKCEALMERIVQAYPDRWDAAYLRICPRVIRKSDVARIPDATFCTAAQLDILAEANLAAKLPPDVLRVIGKRLLTCKGAITTWTNADIKKFKRYILWLPIDSIAALTFRQLLDNLDEWVSSDVANSRLVRVAARRIAAVWKSQITSLAATVKSKLLCLAFADSATRRLVDRDVTVQELEHFLMKANTLCPRFKISYSAIQRAFVRIVTQPGFSWDNDKFEILGKYIGKMAPGIIKKIPTATLCNNWETLKDLNIPKPILMRIFRKCAANFANPASFTCPKLQELGPLIFAMPMTSINSIPDNVFGACIQSIGRFLEYYCQKEKGRCRAFMDKVQRYATNNNIDVGTLIRSLGPHLAGSLRNFANVKLSDLGGISGLAKKSFTPAEAKAVLEKVKAVINPFDESNPRFCASLRKLGPLLAAAGDDTAWNKVCDDGDLLEIVGTVVGNLHEMPTSNIEVIVKKLLRVLNISGRKNVCIDKSLLDRIAPFFFYVKPTDLVRLDKKTLRAIMKAAGQNWGAIQRLNPKKMKFWTELALKNEDLTGSTVLTSEVFERIGPQSLCGLTSSMVNRMDDASVRQYIGKILTCPILEEEPLKALMKKLKTAAANYLENYLSEIGVGIVYFLDELTPAQIESLKEEIVSHLRHMSMKIHLRLAHIKRADKREISDALKAERRNKYRAAIRRLVALAIEVHNANQPVAVRRKRATQALGCPLLSDIKDNVDVLTPAQISSFNTVELQDCLSDLSYAMWDVSQCSALKTHLVSADGLGPTISSWNAADIQDLGTLLDCLTSAEIQMLPIDDTVLSALANRNIQKRSDVIAAWLSTTSPDLSTLSDTSISDMGNLLCGLTPTQLGQLSNLPTAAKNLNNLDCVSEAQLTAVANVIIAQEGTSWATKDPLMVQQLGKWIAGFPHNVLMTFGSEQIKQISVSAIRSMPVSTLVNGFSSNQISQFTVEQMTAVTPEQLQSLSPTIRDIIEDYSDYEIDFDILDVNDGGDDDDDDGKGGVSGLHFNWPVLVSVMALVFYAIRI